MKDLGITKGDWACGLSSDGYCIIFKDRSGFVGIENINDAELIADAGTTANKCGLLPSELLKQRDEMLMFMESILKKKTFHQGNFEYIKELIQKITKQ